MRGNMFGGSFEVLKSLVNELANPRGKVTGRPITVKPEAAEKFHNMHRGNREKRAFEIAEHNLTPNTILDERMSSTPNLHPSDYLLEDEEDQHIPNEEVYGQNITNAITNFGTRSNPFGQPEEKPRSMMEMQRNRFIQNPPQGPLSLQDLRQYPENPVNPFKLKSSPFDYAWALLKYDEEAPQPLRRLMNPHANLQQDPQSGAAHPAIEGILSRNKDAGPLEDVSRAKRPNPHPLGYPVNYSAINTLHDIMRELPEGMTIEDVLAPQNLGEMFDRSPSAGFKDPKMLEGNPLSQV